MWGWLKKPWIVAPIVGIALLATIVIEGVHSVATQCSSPKSFGANAARSNQLKADFPGICLQHNTATGVIATETLTGYASGPENELATKMSKEIFVDSPSTKDIVINLDAGGGRYTDNERFTFHRPKS